MSATTLRLTIMFAVPTIGMLSAPAAAIAQDDVFDAPQPGVHVNHDYWSELPFEKFDTATGGLILTFTDLLLPGNAGRELRFQHSYSNKTGLWVFGMADLVLRVADPGFATDPANTSPTLYTSDGGEQQARLFLTGTTKITDRFWTYDRASRVLSMPDGSVSQFDTAGRLTTWTDTFGNQLQLTWGGGSVTVAQQLGAGQTRAIVVNFPGCTLGTPGCLPSSIGFAGRTWSYTFSISGGGTLARNPFTLTVTPPAGRPWLVVRSSPLDAAPGPVEVTTPHGGRISYYSEYRHFGGISSVSAFATVLRTREVAGPALIGGPAAARRYFYDEAATALGGTIYMRTTTIEDPDGTRTTFRHGVIENSTPAATAYPARVFLMTSRTVEAPFEIERETRTYVNVPVPSANPGDSLPELASQSITRDSRTYVTTYSYDGTNYGDFHHPRLIAESGELSRSTSKRYTHSAGAPLSAPYFVAKQTEEQVTVVGETVTSTWTYNMTNGFQTAKTISGITTTFAPDPFGNVSRVTKQNGKAVEYTYSWGRVSQRRTPNVTVSTSVNLDGTVASETTGTRTTTFTYDDSGRVVGVQPPGGTQPYVTEYDNTNGSWVRTRRGSSSVQTTLDGFGRPIETVNSLGIRTRTVLDVMGRKVYESYPFTTSDIGRSFTYDNLGRVTSETNPRVTRSYFANVVTLTDELTRQSVLAFQSFGDPTETRLASFTDASNRVWSYQYNTSGNLTRVTAPDGVQRGWGYNSRNLLENETHPEAGTTTYGYDSAGNLSGKTDALGFTFQYSYDDDDRLWMVSDVGNSLRTTFAYVPGQNDLAATTVLSAEASGPLVSTFDYDAAGRLLVRHDSVENKTFDLRYDYDATDNVAAITYPSGRKIGYAYDSENRVTRVFNALAPDRNVAHEFEYHPSGTVTSYRSGNGLLTTVGVHPTRYWVTSINVGSLQLTYGYDDVGNVMNITDPRPGHSQMFSYDELDRLKTATGVYGSMLFDYDVHGNRLSAGGTTYTYLSGFRLASVNGMPMTYDNVGNMLTEGSQVTFTYRPDNMPSRVTTGATTTRFLYDANQWRVRKAVDGQPATHFVRDPAGRLLTEWQFASGATAAVRDYVYAGSHLIAVWTAASSAK